MEEEVIFKDNTTFFEIFLVLIMLVVIALITFYSVTQVKFLVNHYKNFSRISFFTVFYLLFMFSIIFGFVFLQTKFVFRKRLTLYHNKIAFPNFRLIFNKSGFRISLPDKDATELSSNDVSRIRIIQGLILLIQ